MVSSISFGQVNTVNGKTVLSGSQSGIDTNALITALTTAKSQPATDAQTKITANQAKITAYNTLKTLVGNLQTSVDALRNPAFGSSTTNVFASRTPFLTVTNGKTVSDYVGVSTSANAPIGTYTMQVNNLATAETRQSGTFTDRTSSVVNASGTNTAGAFAAGTFQINGVNVTVNSGDSLNNVMAAINSTTATSNVTASIVKFADNDYRLTLTAKNTGAANGIVITDASHVLPYNPADTDPTHANTASAPSVTNSMFTITQGADDAHIVFNNQLITRSTNQISDLIDNVTFSLYGKTNGETVTLSIDKDNSGVTSAVGNFVTAYNALRTFQANQNARDSSGNLLPTAILANDSTLNTVMNQLSAMISGQASIAIPSLYASNTSTAPLRLGDLGISLDNVAAGTDSTGAATPAVTNTLTLDPAKLNTNLESYFDDVADIFQFGFTASSPSIGVYKRDNTVTNANFSIAIDTSQPIGSQAKITGIDGSALSSGIALNYKTTSVYKSTSFTDTTSSVVNASGTDTAGAFAAGTFQINGVNVTLAQNASLTDVMNTINTANTGVTASIVKNATNDYSLVLSGTADGTNGVVFTDPDHVLPSTALFANTSNSAMVSGTSGTDLSGFSFSYVGTGNETVQRPSGLTSKDITLTVDTSQVAGSQALITKVFGATLATPVAMTYTASGGSASINGVTGTPFAGLQLVYSGTGNETIDLNMQQGIGDKLYNALNSILNGVSIANSSSSATNSAGLIDDAISQLQTSDTTLQKTIDTINDQVTTYRNQLLDKFAALESAISASNQLLQLLDAQTNAALVNSGH